MLSDLLAASVIGIVKIFVFCYDATTFPAYYVIQKPWRQKAKSERVRARQIDPKDPYSPWVNVEDDSPIDHYAKDCKTLDDLLRKAIEHGGSRRCLGTRHVIGEQDEKQPDGKVIKKLILTDYKWINCVEFDRRIDNVARGLLMIGVKPHSRAMIFAETRLEWQLSAQAMIRIGATICTLYATLGDEGTVHGMNETEVTHIITSHELLPKLKRLQSRLPNVTHIIYMEGFRKPDTEGFANRFKVLPFKELERLGEETPKFVVGERPKEDDVALIQYTSGSTGRPKGVVLTHRNFLGFFNGLYPFLSPIWSGSDEMYLAYLPLAHIMEVVVELLAMILGVPIGYSSPQTLTDNSIAISSGQKGDATLLRPTVFFAVPLVLNRIRKVITDRIASRGPLAVRLFKFAMGYKKFWNRRYYRTPIIDRLLCKRMQAFLGGRLRWFVMGAAPVSPETQEFFRVCFNAKAGQAYGATETTACITGQDYDDFSVGRVGAPVRGVKIKLRDWEEGGYRPTDKPYPRGEVCTSSDAVAKGYFKLEQETKEAYFEENGSRWFALGDIGEIHPDGVLKIIDRKKDLVKLQFGEYVSLGKVEAELKGVSCVDNICVYGDSFYNHTVALVVPSDNGLQALASKLGKTNLSREQLIEDEEIRRAVLKELQEHGKKNGLHKSEIPASCKLVKEDWTPDSGFVTAAMKIRRKNVQEFYKENIKLMYDSLISENDPSKLFDKSKNQ